VDDVLSHDEPRVLQWLASLPKPVGIFTVDDRVARMVVQLCASADRRVPEDTAVLGIYNDELYCRMGYPELSSIDLATQRIGERAAELLDHMMRGGSVPDQPILIDPVRVVVRQSTDMLTIDDEDVSEALRFIRLHATTPITVADVLEHVPISRRSLEYRFARILGRSPAAEIARVQFEHARYLLAESDMPIESVAIASGYSSANYLSYLFRHRLNMTPRQYRLQSTAGD
jgi:LacI family transcriptional regulator